MGSRVLVLLGILMAAALFCTAVANNAAGPTNCCFKFYPKRVKIEQLKSYHPTDSRCVKTGIIVVTVKDVHICMDPALPWVQKTMDTLDERSF